MYFTPIVVSNYYYYYYIIPRDFENSDENVKMSMPTKLSPCMQLLAY